MKPYVSIVRPSISPKVGKRRKQLAVYALRNCRSWPSAWPCKSRSYTEGTLARAASSASTRGARPAGCKPRPCPTLCGRRSPKMTAISTSASHACTRIVRAVGRPWRNGESALQKTRKTRCVAKRGRALNAADDCGIPLAIFVAEVSLLCRIPHGSPFMLQRSHSHFATCEALYKIVLSILLHLKKYKKIVVELNLPLHCHNSDLASQKSIYHDSVWPCHAIYQLFIGRCSCSLLLIYFEGRSSRSCGSFPCYMVRRQCLLRLISLLLFLLFIVLFLCNS